MMDERKPDETITVDVDGFNVMAYSFGSGDEVLFCLNGGPGLPLETRVPPASASCSRPAESC